MITNNNYQNMDKIEIKNSWKDRFHLELLSNAVDSLYELGILPKKEAENIKLAIKEQDDGKIHSS